MANRPALGWFPAEDWVDKIRNSMLSVAPEGLNQVEIMDHKSQIVQKYFTYSTLYTGSKIF